MPKNHFSLLKKFKIPKVPSSGCESEPTSFATEWHLILTPPPPTQRPRQRNPKVEAARDVHRDGHRPPHLQVDHHLRQAQPQRVHLQDGSQQQEGSAEVCPDQDLSHHQPQVGRFVQHLNTSDAFYEDLMS